jgi:hypothetical protein
VPVAATSAHSNSPTFSNSIRFEEDLNISRVRLHAPSASVARSSAALSDPSSPLSTADQETLRQEALIALQRFREQLHCPRGEMENRIKEAQQDLFADRTSTSWMASNQPRLWFSAFAHLMVSVLRAEGVARLGARIKISCRRIHLELASAYPYQETFRRACANLYAMPAG